MRRHRQTIKDPNADILKFAKNTFTSINQRTINGKYAKGSSKQTRSYLNQGIETHLVKDEYFQFILDNADLIRKIWATGDKASIDRIENSGNYTLENIQIIPLKENIKKRNLIPKKKAIRKPRIYSKIHNKLQNRKAYLMTTTLDESKAKPFDDLLLTLPFSLVVTLVENSREELKTELINQEREGK